MENITYEKMILSLTPGLNKTEKEQLKSFFFLYKSYHEELWLYGRKRLSEIPVFRYIIHNIPKEELEVRRRLSLEITRNAILENDWRPWIEDLMQQGINYANMGLDFHSWYDVVKMVRDFFVPKLSDSGGVNHHKSISTMNGMDNFIHIAMRAISEAYLNEKQRIIEEQKRDRKKLDDDLQLLVYNVSHDLKQPLTTVQGLVSLMKEQYPELAETDAGDYLDHIKKSTDWMDQIIAGLMDYSRIGQSRKPEKVDLNEIIEDNLLDLYSQIKDTQAEIKVGKLPTLRVYPIEVKLLFQNLIGNALKYRREECSPEIKINAEKKDNIWRFSVEDNGIGIDEKHNDEIFVIFRRLHNSSQYNGTGIGLAHCKKIVELHKGKIWVESEPDIGSKFIFTIPASAGDRYEKKMEGLMASSGKKKLTHVERIE